MSRYRNRRPFPRPQPNVPQTVSESTLPAPVDPDEQFIQHMIDQARRGLPVSDDAELLRQLEDSIPQQEALLAKLEAEEASREQDMQATAKTPLALRLEVVSCRYATEIWSDHPDPAQRKTIPEYRFEQQPCPFGKTIPDQDCRSCVHVKLLPYGANQPYYDQRYQGHGLVLPLTEEGAEKVGKMLNVLNVRPLTSPHLMTHALKKNLALARQRRIEARNRELERHQRGINA